MRIIPVLVEDSAPGVSAVTIVRVDWRRTFHENFFVTTASGESPLALSGESSAIASVPDRFLMYCRFYYPDRLQPSAVYPCLFT
jgi:hypothetical protein